jgi:choline dehydrogenase-like flavoprotein
MTRDVVIIGSGAGGGPLALRLSQANWDVVVLEKGPRHIPADYGHDEIRMLLQPNFWWPSPDTDPHVLVDHTPGGDSTPQHTRLGWIGGCVGGGTAHMSGSFYRFHPDDFRLRTRLGDYEAVEDWPYGYDELEPYYGIAEWEVGVSGRAGANPFEGFRSRPYPMPPLQPHRFTAEFDGACDRLGLHPFPTPRGINSIPHNGRPGCAYCDFCVGYGCPTGARSGSHEALIRRAEATGRCEVRPDVMVREVTVGRDGRATGCIYLDATGTEHRVDARIVCVCCSAVESARLLLLSRSRSHPDGLANGTGLVGRHLQFHGGSAGRARFREERHPGWRAAPPTHIGRSVMDHYYLPAGVSPFAKGGLHRFDIVPTHPVHHAYSLAFGQRGDPVWGEGLKQRLRAHFREGSEVEFEVFQDFVPNDRTRVELDPEVTDRWGLPAARIHLDEPEHHRVAGRWLAERGLEILETMGAEEAAIMAAGRTSRVMAHGTCRAGADPRTSVLNAFCQAHEVPNLFVVDGSFMPTSGGAPSTLSILANSFRTADYLVSQARTREIA